ncbi:hypothetical protein EV132_114168 [Rhizobium sullae]|uniref:Uncharacterized protein n=1 Tax=Rhizobium sullae TaxID=50338 RepID=A0A4R3PYL1_RHISU|nr:hypothetical protein EV132_114168 [Rhizobium sullae]
MQPAVQWNITKVIAPTMTHPEMIIRDILNNAVLIVMKYPTSRQFERTAPRGERAHRTDASSRPDYV